MNTKRLPLFVVPLLLIITNAQAQPTRRAESPPWTRYTIHDEDFSVALPNLPAFHINSEFLERIGKNRRVYNLGAYADGVVYVVYIYDNPKPRQSLQSFLEEQGSTSPSLNFSDLSLDGFPGKVVSSQESVSQFFAIKDRLYRIMALGAPADDPRMTKFFSSFSLRKKKDSIEVTDGPGLPYEPAGEPESSDDETTKKIYTGREVDRKARLAMRPQPSYTEAARKNAVTGTVVLKAVFARNGSVTNIRTVSGLPFGLTDKAIEVARKIKFVPAMKDGKPVSMWMQLEYNFNLY